MHVLQHLEKKFLKNAKRVKKQKPPQGSVSYALHGVELKTRGSTDVADLDSLYGLKSPFEAYLLVVMVV
jgi:hypothetical protein